LRRTVWRSYHSHALFKPEAHRQTRLSVPQTTFLSLQGLIEHGYDFDRSSITIVPLLENPDRSAQALQKGWCSSRSNHNPLASYTRIFTDLLMLDNHRNIMATPSVAAPSGTTSKNPVQQFLDLALFVLLAGGLTPLQTSELEAAVQAHENSGLVDSVVLQH